MKLCFPSPVASVSALLGFALLVGLGPQSAVAQSQAQWNSLFDRIIKGPMQNKIPSVMTSTLSLRPDIFGAVMAAGKPILFEGELPGSVKQMIVMIIANRRQCRFCTEVHRAMLEAMGIDDSLIDSCVNDAEMRLVPPMYRQILQFALEAADNPNDVGDDAFDSLRDSGLSESEILEVSMVTAYANFLVTWTDVAVELDG